MVGRFSRISLGCFASDHDSINDDDREWSRSCAADEDERSLDATAPIAPIRNHNDALLEAAKVMAEHLGASILTRSSNTIDDDGISQESSGIDPVHNRASGDGTRDDSTEAFQNLSFVELLTLHGELLARREAEFQQLAQLQATAQRRSQAHAIGTLRLAQLEEIQRKMDESCQEICTISQSVAPSPDLEVRRARERQMYKLQREGGHAATFFSKRNVHPAQAPAFMINELGKKTKEAARFYDASMHNFERSWKIVAQRADGWAETPARWDWAYSRLQAEEVSGGQQERWARTEKALHDILPHPPSWLDELSRDDAKRTTATLENLLNDFESTSKKICALTGQDLSGLLTRPSTEPSAKLPAGSKEAATPASRIPLENLFHLAFVAHGSDGMLRLAKELFINAVPTLMSGGVRQSEMEKLLLAVLDVLHSSRQEVRQDSLTSHLDGLPGGGGAAATFGRSGASSSTIRWLLQPSLTLEQELLRYVKEAQQRASQRRAEIIRSLPLEAMSDDESDSADAAYSARSISASFANTMASTASSWYSSVADGFSTLQGAASGTLFAGHEGPPSETDATAPGLHSPAAAPKPSLYERSQTPTSHPSKSPLGLSSYISPASPTAAKVSSSWTAEQASRISDKSSADIDVGLASASGTPSRHDAAQSRLSNLSHISPSPGPKSHRVRKESIRVVPGLSPIRLPSTATSTAPTTVEITDAQQEEHHVREAATQLLEKLLKQPDSASPSVPIVVALARAILQDRFSAAAEPETHRHLKILILVRWWAFKHMRGMLCDLFSVSRSWSAVGYGISAMEDDFLSRDDGQHQKFMEDTWLSDPGVIEQLAALHKALYVAITDAVNAREAYSGLQEAAAQAIKAFVPLSSPRISTTPKLKTTPTPVRREKIPAAFALTYQEYAALTVPLHFGVVPKLERSVAGEATFFVQRSGPNDARLARSHRFTIAATLAARVQPSTSKTHRSPNGISWSPITAKPSSNGMTTKPQLNNLSGFSTSSGRGLSRALSGWGSPVGSPGEMSLVPVAGAGFFDVTAAPAPTHAHRNGTPSESLATAYWQKLSAPTRRDLRRGFELLALLGSSAAVPDPLTAAHIALQQVTAQQRWADTALLQWWVREVENLAAAHGKLFLVSLMRLCVSKAEEDSRIIGDATQTVSLLLARLASDWHSSILTAQRLFSSMHELRSKIWYASAIRTCAALQQAWFAAPLSHAKEDLQQWLTSTGVQDLQIGDDNFSIIVALDEGFAAIAGDAGQFFANQIWQREADCARPFLKQSKAGTGKDSTSSEAAVTRSGVCHITLLTRSQHRPPPLSGLEDFLQKVQMRATGFFLMESLQGLQFHSDNAKLDSLAIPARKSATESSVVNSLVDKVILQPSPHLKLNASFQLHKFAAAEVSVSKHSPTETMVARTPRKRRGTFASQFSDGPESPRPFSLIGNAKVRRVLSIYDVSEGQDMATSLDAMLFGSAVETRTPTSAPVADTPAESAEFDESVPNVGATPEEILEKLESYLGAEPLSALLVSLQFVIAFAPASVLNVSDKGKAIWDLSVAVLSCRQDRVKAALEQASQTGQPPQDFLLRLNEFDKSASPP